MEEPCIWFSGFCSQGDGACFEDITVTRNSPTGQAMTTDAEAAVSEALRDLAFWLYRQLENKYDWLTSDTAVDEALLINEYTFTEADLRAG